MSGPRISFLIPAYNEEERILPTLDTILSVVRPLKLSAELIVVDDGSTDRTAEVLAGATGRIPELRVEHHPRNLGLAAAYYRAVSVARGRSCMYISADNDIDAPELRQILVHLDEADVLIQHCVNECERGAFRRGLSRAYGAILRMLTGRQLRYFNGFTVYPRDLLGSLVFRERSFAFQADLLLQALAREPSFLEIGIRCRFNDAGSRALRPRNVLGVLSFIVRLLIDRLHPHGALHVRQTEIR